MNLQSIVNAFHEGDTKTKMSILCTAQSSRGECLETLIKEGLLCADGWVKIEAIRLLEQHGESMVLPLRQAWRESLEPYIRWLPIEVLRSAASSDISGLVLLLNDVNWWDRVRIPWVLSKSDDKRGDQMLLRCLNNEDCHLRFVAASLVSTLQNRLFMDTLITLAHTDPSRSVQFASLRALEMPR